MRCRGENCTEFITPQYPDYVVIADCVYKGVCALSTSLPVV
jgi:hypothetical protein